MIWCVCIYVDIYIHTYVGNGALLRRIATLDIDEMVCTYIYIYIYIYIYTHTHIHPCMRNDALLRRLATFDIDDMVRMYIH
jgi:hypothetical protein